MPLAHILVVGRSDVSQGRIFRIGRVSPDRGGVRAYMLGMSSQYVCDFVAGMLAPRAGRGQTARHAGASQAEVSRDGERKLFASGG